MLRFFPANGVETTKAGRRAIGHAINDRVAHFGCFAYNPCMVRISKEEKKAVLAFLEAKREHRQRALTARFEQATADAQRIVRMIAEGYFPRRIYQWGSLLERRRFQEISDIDIAVEGLKGPEKIFEIYAEAEKMTDLPLDIVEIERIHPLHAQSIRERGRVVYERPD